MHASSDPARITALYGNSRRALPDVGGMHARNQAHGSYQMGLKREDRVSLAQSRGIRVKSQVGVTAGRGLVTDPGDYARTIGKGQGTGKNARKRAARRNAGL